MHVLHMAPERCLYDLFEGHPRIQYTCMDLHPELYSFAKNCRKENAMTMSFTDRAFDIIISNHVIEHVPDAKKFIFESLRCLKKDGMLT